MLQNRSWPQATQMLVVRLVFLYLAKARQATWAAVWRLRVHLVSPVAAR